MKRDKLVKQIKNMEIKDRKKTDNDLEVIDLINSISDDDMLKYCQECVVCGQKEISDEELDEIIELSKNAKDFFLYMDELRNIKRNAWKQQIKSNKKAIKDLGIAEFIEKEIANENQNPPCHY